MNLTDFCLADSSLSKSSILETYLDSQGQITISLEGYLTTGSLVFVVKVLDRGLHGQGLGYQAFQKIINHFGIGNITSIAGSWHEEDEFSSFEDGMSTNLLIFRRELGEGNSPGEAAFLTPTGKWVRRLGFNNVKIITCSQHSVRVRYTR